MDGSNFSIGRAIDKQVVIDRYYRPSTNSQTKGYWPQFCGCFFLICNRCNQQGYGTLQSPSAEEIQKLSNMLSGQLLSSSDHIPLMKEKTEARQTLCFVDYPISRADDINGLHYLFCSLWPSSILVNTKSVLILISVEKRNHNKNSAILIDRITSPQCQICKEEFTRKQLPLPYPGVT